MIIGKVVGHVVSTQKDTRLTGYKLLTVQPLKNKDVYMDEIIVAVDAVGAGIGEIVLLTTGSTARHSVGKSDSPIDSAIVGIIDTVNISCEQH